MRELASARGESLVRGERAFSLPGLLDKTKPRTRGESRGFRFLLGGNHVMRGISITLYIYTHSQRNNHHSKRTRLTRLSEAKCIGMKWDTWGENDSGKDPLGVPPRRPRIAACCASGHAGRRNLFVSSMTKAIPRKNVKSAIGT